MASGRTLRLNRMRFKLPDDLPRGGSRDRTLRGKARVRARKARNRRVARGDWS